MTPANVKKAVARMFLTARDRMAEAGETAAKVTVRRHKLAPTWWIIRVAWPDMTHQHVVTDTELIQLRDPAIVGEAVARTALHGAAKLWADKEVTSADQQRRTGPTLRCQGNREGGVPMAQTSNAPTTPNPAPHGDWHHCPICGDPTNYEPNPVQWTPGALVIHDADEKKPHMLMIVLKVNGHRITTQYLDQGDRRPKRPRTWENNLCALHDPARWGISPKEGD